MNKKLENCPAPEKCREKCEAIEYQGSIPKCGSKGPCIYKSKTV